MALSPEEELELLELEEAEYQHQKTKTPKTPDVSMGESVVRGATQGATMGFADELGGLAQQGMDKVYGLFGDSVTDVNKKLADQGFTGDIGPTDSGALYTQARNENRLLDAQAQEANPLTYGGANIAGNVVSGLAMPFTNAAKGASVLNAASKGAALGGLQGLGNTTELDQNALMDIGVGAAIGGAGSGIGQAISSKIANINQAGIANKAYETADDLRLKATGATGKELSNFDPGAGRALKDHVKFGDNARNIADRLESKIGQAGSNIGSILDDLDSKGVTANIDNVVASLESKIKELNQVSGNERLIAQLKGEIENLYERGQSTIPVSLSEQAKRNYQGMVNFNSPVVEQKAATHLGRAFREEGERAATEFNPDIGKAFKEEKDLFGLLTPIQKAAERRANTTQQSPIGGLLDVSSAIAGGGPLTGIASAVGRRVLSPRVASSAAVGFDKVGDILKNNPQMFGKFAGVLQSASQRGSQALGATHFLLQQQNPEYQQLMKNLRDGE